jgi:hypothetical protein
MSHLADKPLASKNALLPMECMQQIHQELALHQHKYPEMMPSSPHNFYKRPAWGHNPKPSHMSWFPQNCPVNFLFKKLKIS